MQPRAAVERPRVLSPSVAESLVHSRASPKRFTDMQTLALKPNHKRFAAYHASLADFAKLSAIRPGARIGVSKLALRFVPVKYKAPIYFRS